MPVSTFAILIGAVVLAAALTVWGMTAIGAPAALIPVFLGLAVLLRFGAGK